MARLCLATGDSVVVATESPAGWALEAQAAGSRAMCLAVDPNDPTLLYGGTEGHGVLRSTDGGRSWTQTAAFRLAHVYSVAVSSSERRRGRGAVYAGTEPSALFLSEDGGDRWVELEALQSIPSKPQWSFPPRPYTHHLRCIALSAHDPALILAGIELGGVMRSTDGGRTWEDHRDNAYHDCHWLVTHPKAPGYAYQAAGGGAATSHDDGNTWRRIDAGLDNRWYAWAVAVDPGDPALVYLSACPSPYHAHVAPTADAALYRRRGNRWEEVGGGLTPPLASLPMAIAVDSGGDVYAGLRGGDVYAGLRDGTIFRSRDKGESWERIPLPALTTILAMTAV